MRTDDLAARQRTEHSLAIARAVLAAGCLIAASASYGAPRLVFILLVLYAAHSFATLALLTGRSTIPAVVPRVLHAADLAWAGALTLVTEGPASPFFAMFAFVMLAAAYRWRRRETLITGAVSGAVLAVQAWLLNGPAAAAGLPLAQVPLEWTAVRGAHLAVTAVLLGYLAEDDKLHRAQVAAMSELLGGIQSQPGFHAALRYAAGTLMSLTGSDRLALAAKETGPGRTVLWSAARASANTALTLASSALAREAEPPYFFGARGDAWSITQRGSGCRITSLNAGGEPVSSKRCEVPDDFFSTHGARAAAIVSVGFGGHWKGRVFLLRDKGFSLTELRFIHKVLCQLVPAMHNQYLLRRLRSRVSAVERRRIARELHDGVIQSLVGLELQTAALRRRLGNRDSEVDEQLHRIQRLLGTEALAIRDVMHQIRPVDAGPGELLPSLAEIVDRFSRDSDIVADFHSGEADIYLPPRIARELARTLQEALTNVRKHAHASYVRVTLDARGPFWQLAIENDGRPFPFMGRMTLRELEAGRLGPRVIKERVREMGGDLLIESTANGVRLEISLPRADEQPKSA